MLVNEFIEHMSIVFPGRTALKERRKVQRTTPTSEGDDGFHILGNVSDGVEEYGLTYIAMGGLYELR